MGVQSELGEAWKRMSVSDKRRSVAAASLCLWAIVLTADMYFLRQRPDFQERFNLPADDQSGSTADADAEEEERPWRRKSQVQTDAEIAQRAAQLQGFHRSGRDIIAGAAAPPAGGNQQQPPVAQASPQADVQTAQKSLFSFKFKW